MVFSIHQPNYIPFLGYFYKIVCSDVFVILDSVQYPRGQSYSPRNRIKTPSGPVFLTIPVSVPKNRDGKVSYLEVGFSGNKWKEKHIKTLELNYKRAEFFTEVMEIYSDKLLANYGNLSELNSELIRAICDYLDIRTKIVFLSSLLPVFGSKTQLIIDIAKSLDADTYLSGTGGGREYNDENLMRENGVKLLYSDFKHPVYTQLWDGFIPNLSVMDFLFNCGPDLDKIIRGN